MAIKKKFDALDLVRRIRNRYAQDKFAVFGEVNSGTGAYANSWIDVAVVALWPSEGLVRRAFEVKVSRQDFLREIANPNKNAWVRDFFHEFWFVAPSDVIKEQELPEGAGWMKPRGESQLQIVRSASRKEKPDLDDLLLASFCRSAHKESLRYKKEIKEELKSDREFVKAFAWKEAAERFIKHKSLFFNPTVKDHKKMADEAYAVLIKAYQNQDISDQQQNINSILNTFKNRIGDLVPLMNILALAMLNEVDDTGDRLIKTWSMDLNAEEIKKREDLWMYDIPEENKKLLELLIKLVEKRGDHHGEDGKG